MKPNVTRPKPLPALTLLAALFASICESATADEVVALPSVDVSGSRTGFAVSNATTATKTDTPLMETPASVQVVPGQVLSDQMVTTLDQAISNVAGARSSSTGWSENIYLRGFVTSTYLRDGYRLSDPNWLGGQAYLSNIDRIEVLKGPGSILYGQLEPGGVINLVTKKPQAAASYSFEQSLGSWNHSITTVDATGPLDTAGRVLYYADLSYDSGDSWVNNVSNQRLFIAPSVQWNPDPSTQLNLELTYSRNRTTIYQQAIVPFDTTTRQFQWGDRSANPAPYRFDPNTLFAGFEWLYRLNADWQIKQKVAYSQVDFSTPLNPSTAWGPMSLVGDTWVIGLNSAQLDGNTRSAGTFVDLTGHFVTGPARHTLLLGVDYNRLTAYYNSRYSSPYGPFIDVPLYSSSVPSLAGLPLDPDTFFVSDTTTTSYGAYLQDQLSLPGGVEMLAGVRYQKVRANGTSSTGINLGGSGLPEANASINDQAWTPRIGLLWRPNDWLSLYASYTENFGASNAASGTDWKGNPLPPEGATQYEIGAKAQLPGRNAYFTLSLFNLIKNNLAVADYAHPNPAGGYYQTAVGEAQSKGVEVTLQGELQRGWDLLLSYSYDPVKFTKGTDVYPTGTAMPQVPANMARLFTTYAFDRETLPGWKIGGGLQWQSRAPGFYLNPDTGVMDSTTITSPSYVVFDAMASYAFQAWGQSASVQLNVNNLFNRSYYTDAFMYVAPFGAVTYGAPRSFMATASIAF